MPLIDRDIDGGIFDSGRAYAPDKADFVELPFEWLAVIHNGDLSRRLNFMLDGLVQRYPHLPAAKIAESINVGVTKHLREICDNSNNSVYADKIDFDCSSVLSSSPIFTGDSNYASNMDELASIVQDKMGGYFNYYR